MTCRQQTFVARLAVALSFALAAWVLVPASPDAAPATASRASLASTFPIAIPFARTAP